MVASVLGETFPYPGEGGELCRRIDRNLHSGLHCSPRLLLCLHLMGLSRPRWKFPIRAIVCGVNTAAATLLSQKFRGDVSRDITALGTNLNYSQHHNSGSEPATTSS